MFDVSKPQVTMTSLELVEFINANEDRESELRHDHFMAKVPKVLGDEAAPKFRDSYTGKDGTSRPMYRLPKREACLMAMSYSYDLQAKVYDRMTALEERKPDPMQILSDPTAMRGLLLTYTEKVIALEATVERQAPKVEAFERIGEAEGAICITNAAKHLKCQPKRLFQHLQGRQWIYRRAGGSGYIGYQDKVQAGLLEHKVTTVERSDGTVKMVEQVLVTPKGLAKLAQQFTQH